MSKTDWLHKRNADQCEWALSYLQKIESLPDWLYDEINSTKTPCEIISTVLSHTSHSAETKEIIRLLKRAWSGKISVIKAKAENRSQRNYMLHMSAVDELEWLAKDKKMPLNKTIELLINRGFDFEKEAKRDAKKEREKQKAERSKKANTDKRTEGEIKLRAVERKLEEAERSYEELDKKFNEQLKTRYEYIIKLKDLHEFNTPLTDKQKERRDQKLQEK